MENCPIWSEFVVLEIMQSENQVLVNLHSANRELSAIIMPGQGKSHGMALLGEVKNDEFPNGNAWKFIEKAKIDNKPQMQVL